MAKKKTTQAANTATPTTPAQAVVVQSAEEIELQQLAARADQLRAKVEADKAAKIEAKRNAFVQFCASMGIIVDTNNVGDAIKALNTELRGLYRSAKSSGGTGRGPGRGPIDEVTKAKVHAALKAGQKSGVEIAQEFGVSVPWVQGQRKELGLVKSRSAAAGK